MKRQNVISSVVRSIGWEDGKMEVQFNTGTIYLYDNVNLDTFQKIRISDSIGSAIQNEVVKMGNKGEKIHDPNKRE